jgi:hypothetical protein
LSNPRERSSAIALDALREWIATTLVNQGEKETVRRIKAYANYCRARALRARQTESAGQAARGFPTKIFERGLIKAMINDPEQGRFALAQLARIGRSMPQADDSTELQALITHREILAGEPREISQALLDQYFWWAKQWGVRYGSKVKDSVTVRFSSSAAESVARSRGGQKKELMLLAAPQFEAIRAALFEDDEAWGIATATVGEDYIGTCSEEDDLTIIVDSALYEVDRDLRRDKPIPVRASSVRELGWKARIVTSAPAHWVVAGDAVRQVLWPLLEADPRTDLTGRREDPKTGESGSDEVVRSLRGARSIEFYSADLTAATDYMPFHLTQAIWMGLCTGLGIDLEDRFVKIGHKLLGSVAVTYPDGPDGRPVAPYLRESKRGCMMGLPLSWTILNLYNLATADLALLPDAETGNVHDVFGHAPAVIRGDDLAGGFSPMESTRYAGLIDRTGGDANPAKSFVSGDSFVFAERTFLVSLDLSVDERLPHRGFRVFNPDISDQAPFLARDPHSLLKIGRSVEGGKVIAVRMLEDLPVRHLMPAPDENGLPSYVSLPPACAAVADEAQTVRMRMAVSRAVLSLNADLVSRFKNYHLSIFVPREIGGVGFPHPKGWGHGILSGTKAWRRRATLNITTFGARLRRRLGLSIDPWKLTGVDDFERQRAEQQISGEAGRIAPGQLGTAVAAYEEDLVLARTAEALAWSTTMWNGPRPRLAAPRLSAIKKVTDRLLETATKAKFPDAFVIRSALSKDDYLYKAEMARSLKQVYTSSWNKRSGRTVRLSRFTAQQHKGPIPRGLKRLLGQKEEGGPVPVSTTRSGLTLGDVAMLRQPRRVRRRR